MGFCLEETCKLMAAAAGARKTQQLPRTL